MIKGAETNNMSTIKYYVDLVIIRGKRKEKRIPCSLYFETDEELEHFRLQEYAKIARKDKVKITTEGAQSTIFFRTKTG